MIVVNFIYVVHNNHITHSHTLIYVYVYIKVHIQTSILEKIILYKNNYTKHSLILFLLFWEVV